MKNKFFGFGFIGLLLLSCGAPLRVANIHTEKNTYITDQLPDDAQINAVIEPYKHELEGKMSTKISHTNVELTKSGDNSNLGNLLADYTFEGADSWAKAHQLPPVDAAVINIGGIRTIIPKGDILSKQIYEVMPFENEIVIVKISGKELQGLFDYYLQTQKNNPVSHLTIETQNGKLLQKLINGNPVDNSKTYYIATSDYLSLGGDNMFFFGKGEVIPTGLKMRDLFLEKFKQNPEVSSPSDIRLIFRDKKVKQ